MKFRKVLFWLHLAAGLVAGIFILNMAVTGTILAFESQITSWADARALNVRVDPGKPRMPVEEIVKRSPALPSSISLSNNPSDPVTLGFGRGKDPAHFHPQTGENLGAGAKSTHDFFHFITGMHRWWAVGESARGLVRQITGAACFCMLFLVVSGLILWFPKRWSRRAFAAIGLFKTKLKGRAKHWNRHNAIGFWTCVPLFLITSTGLVIAYPWASDLLYRVTGNEPPPRREPGGAARGPRPAGAESPRAEKPAPAAAPLGLAAAIEDAERRVPEWKTISARFPEGNSPTYTITIDRGQSGQPHLRSQLTVDAASGAVQTYTDFGDENTGRQLRMLARYTHTGQAGGLVGQILAFIAAIGAVLLIYTGYALSWRRFFGKKKRAAPPESIPSQS